MPKTPFAASQVKSIEAIRVLSQTAVENVQELAQIHHQATQELLMNADACAAGLMKVQDPRVALAFLHNQFAQEAVVQMTAYQQKVAEVLRHSKQELAESVNTVMYQSQEDWKELVATVTSNAPTESEAFVSAFTNAFDAVIQNFDQVRATTQEAFMNSEKSAESLLNSTQDQHVQTVKPTTKARKPNAS